MNIKGKVLCLCLLGIGGMLALIIFGSRGMRHLSYGITTIQSENNDLINHTFLPIINDKVKNIESLNLSIRHLLNADRDAFQALMAEKISLSTADEDALKKLELEHLGYLANAKSGLEAATKSFDETQADMVKEVFVLFSKWEEKTQKVIAYCKNPIKLKFARRISGGSAFKAFSQLREKLSELQSLLKNDINTSLASLNQDRQVALRASEKSADFVVALQVQSEREQLTFYIVAVLVSLLSLISGYRFSKTLGRSLACIVKVAQSLAIGKIELEDEWKDLQKNSKRRDELGLLARSMENLIQYNKSKGEIANQVSLGQLNVEVSVECESDALSQSLHLMITNLSQMIQAIDEQVQDLHQNANRLDGISRNLDQDFTVINTQSRAVASATEEMSVGIQSVSDQAKTLLQQMTEVAQAVEDLRANVSTVDEISRRGAELAESAKHKVERAGETMGALDEAANNIGNVTNLIKSIAEKTNLLALNATIEAASAGDAGKGFSVVAGEIKELAGQSAKAAEGIAAQISDVQSNTLSGVTSIKEVIEIIHELNQANGEISGSVQHQVGYANLIASHMESANEGIGVISRAIAETATGSGEISESVTEVHQRMDSTLESISNIKTSATELNQVSQNLNREMAKFQNEGAS